MELTPEQKQMSHEMYDVLEFLSKQIRESAVTKGPIKIRIENADGDTMETNLDALHNAWRSITGDMVNPKVKFLEDTQKLKVSKLLYVTFDYTLGMMVPKVEGKDFELEQVRVAFQPGVLGRWNAAIDLVFRDKLATHEKERVRLLKPLERDECMHHALMWSQLVGRDESQWLGTHTKQPILEIIGRSAVINIDLIAKCERAIIGNESWGFYK